MKINHTLAIMHESVKLHSSSAVLHTIKKIKHVVCILYLTSNNVNSQNKNKTIVVPINSTMRGFPTVTLLRGCFILYLPIVIAAIETPKG